MKQRTLLFVLVLLSALTASAQETKVGGIYYNLVAETKQAIVTYGDTKYTGRVIIPSSIKYNNVTYSVTSIGSFAFEECSNLKSVTIPNSVTSIGESAFYGCSGLKSVIIGTGVHEIGFRTFWDCPGLTSISIENGNTKYDSRKNCNAIIETASNTLYVGCQNTIIPNSVTSIEAWAFTGCSGLKSVVIPNSVKTIESFAFEDCSGLTSVIIPNSVTSIGDEAFSGCSALTSVTIPQGVTSIEGFFRGCSSLTSVTIPGSVTSIEGWAFSGCSSLKSVTIPNNVTSIGTGAFFGCSGLTSVTIPSSVTSIGDGAFWGCSGLTKVTIPKSVISIGDRAFWDCSGLKSISVESGNPKYKSHKNNTAIIENATNTVIASCNKTEEDSIIYKVNLQPSVIFMMGKATIARSQTANIEMIAKYANEHKDCKLLLQGFAYEPDCGAKSKKEWEAIQYIISKHRADNVKTMLIKRYKIDPDRIITKGCGFTDKLYDEVEFNRVVIFHDLSK